jgi:cytochrome c biogenesis protein CcdA
MLPAYLGLYLRGDAGRAATATQRVARALRVGGAVTAGFVALFGVAGAVLALGTRSVTGAFPWLGLATGLLLVVVGAWSWFGGAVYTRLGERLSHGVAGVDRADLRGYAAFGLAMGAVLVAGSDVAVGRERFGTRGFVNKLAGLPAYYLGQVLIALALGGS